MRKCHLCGAITGLKQIVCTGAFVCNCKDDDIYHTTSTCKNCYFESCACEEDGHDVSECLKDESCPNHKKTVAYLHNWDDFDYYFQPKKKVLQTVVAKRQP